ncbi:MAG: hypothetical protein JNJ77_16130 [Planctomycetia bacterium]|nr:hypothetical protein [Planctomycetia bacterium]
MAVLLLCVVCANPSVQNTQQPIWKIVGTLPDKQELDLLQESLETGRKRIEHFFGKPFLNSFEVEVFPDRTVFDQYFAKRWKVPKTQSWMVASGVGDKLTMLSRKVWKTQASEHKPEDEPHYRELIGHELVHVYHGQRNPTGDFEGMDDLGWLVEGLAVYVSGQLDRSHRLAAQDAIRLGKGPRTLANAWSGKYRYGVCGSMVQWIDQKWGRASLDALMKVTRQEDAMKVLEISEKEFLIGWEQFVKMAQQKTIVK